MKEKIKEMLIELTSKHEGILESFKKEPNYHYKNTADLSFLYDDCMNQLMIVVGSDKLIKWNFPTTDKGRAYNYKSDIKGQPTHVIEFNGLYPNVLLKLYDEGLLKFNCKAFGDVILTLFRNKDFFKKEFLSSDVWLLTKILINWTYGKLGSDKSIYSVDIFRMISLYTKPFFDMLIEMCPKSILEIKIDEIYIKNYDNEYVNKCIHHVLDKLDLPYEIEKI